MKLLLDEMFSPKIANALRARGHDVVAIGERSDWRGSSDVRVLEIARAERRVLVTNNVRDFRPLHHAAITPGGEGHFGMVFAPGSGRSDRDHGRIVGALEELLASRDDLADGEAWL